MIDLHVHSTHSDGTLRPAALLQYAHQQQITVLALADHDCITGIDEATTAGKELNIAVIPAVELSVSFERYTDVHLLAYGINHHDPALRQRLNLFCARRDSRNEAIVERINAKLQRQGRQPISTTEVTALADGAIGRPHIARVLMEHDHVRTMEEAFERYLVPCNVPKEYFAMDEAINEIHRAGGIAVLAHPTSITNDLPTLEQIINRLRAMGLDGIEVYNNMAAETETARLLDIARRHNIIITGGSDYHGIEAAEEKMGVIRGELAIPEELGTTLLATLMERQQCRS
jgi:predicted metal-dependent phosphoesterase TrpH